MLRNYYGKICGLFVLCLPILSQAGSILEILQVEPSVESQDFVDNKKQFQLHTLITEQRHPKTWDLGHKIQTNTLAGIEMLLSVDEDVSAKILELSKNTTFLEQAATAVKEAIVENRKIYFYGCGATGRLAKQMESSFWRPFWKKMQSLPQWATLQKHFPDIHNRLIGEMTGADRALISSLEGFEDLQLIGKLQLADHHIEQGDVIFAVTEGGETSSVIGTILAGVSHYDMHDPQQVAAAQKHLYFVYNNPDDVLLPFERSRTVIENKAITKICLFTGQQSITGSTRMQATTSETFILGVVLEHALYQLLEPHLSKAELYALGFSTTTIRERLLSFLPVREAVYKAQNAISQLTEMEANTYANKNTSVYFAQKPLITVFIDSTERAPTFRLFPLDTIEATAKKSWIQVWTPARDKLDAWEKFLGRPFCGLNKEMYEAPFSENIQDPYLKAAAIRSLKNAGDEQQFLYDFSYSPKNVDMRGLQENDLGVMVLFANEIPQLLDPSSSFQSWLKTFDEKKAKVAIILVLADVLTAENPVMKTIASLAPQAQIVQLPFDNIGDPIELRQHIGLKMLLNAHSTGVMAKLGRVVGNTMAYVNPGNLKLIGRATFLIQSHVNDKLPMTDKISYREANAILFDAMEYAKKTQKVGQNTEVGLSIIRILESMKNKKAFSWEGAEVILQTYGLEGYLRNNEMKN